MVRFNPQSIMQLAKLNRVVHKETGHKYAIGEQSDLESLISFVQDNPNQAFDDVFREFVESLTESEREQLNIRDS